VELCDQRRGLLRRHGRSLGGQRAAGTIVLGLSDGAGWRDHTEVSLYGCDDAVAGVVRAAWLAGRTVEGEPWYQSDHGLFMRTGGRPGGHLSGFAELCQRDASATHSTWSIRKVAEIALTPTIARLR
jgi:hypothetical protein